MGKWAARLAAETAVPPSEGTDKTAKREVVSVLSVPAKGGADVFHAAHETEAPLAPAAPDVSPVAWSGADIARFLDRRARLLRWGWPEADAEALAERLVRRDREGNDRVSCTDCRHYRPGRCGNHRRAGLGGADVGRALAGLLQRCQGFAQRTGDGGPTL